MTSNIHKYGVQFNSACIVTSGVGKQLFRKRREIMKGKNSLRKIGGFVLAASLLFGAATMSSTVVQAQGRFHGGGFQGGGFHGGEFHGGFRGGGFHDDRFRGHVFIGPSFGFGLPYTYNGYPYGYYGYPYG
jgi:hypothetical protein